MEAADDPDLELVRALQRGEERALGELMQRHEGGIFRFLYRGLSNAADAADLTQETFVRAYFKISQFRPGARFSVWLYRIALNLLRDRARSRTARAAARTVPLREAMGGPTGTTGRREHAPSEPPAATSDPARALEEAEERQAVEEAIRGLPTDLKAAFVLTVLEGRSQRDAGEILGTTPKAVETRVYRARKLLATRLRAIWP